MINGRTYDFESMKLQTPVGTACTISEINYDGSKDVEIKTDMKGIPRGYARKAYEGSFDCTMSLEEYNLLNSAAGIRGILAMDPMPVIVSFAQTGAPIVIHQLSVKITKVTPGVAKDDEVTVKIEGKQTAVMKINGKPIYTAI